LAVAYKDSQKATVCFKKAISLSQKYGFIHEEALAYEREGMFLMGNQSLESAKVSLKNAYLCYQKWGAKALTDKLTKKYPDIFTRKEMLAFKSSVAMTLQVNEETETSVSVLTDTFSTCSGSKRKRVTFKE